MIVISAKKTIPHITCRIKSFAVLINSKLIGDIIKNSIVNTISKIKLFFIFIFLAT